MPNYYNPYNFYPVGYANQMGYVGGMQAPQMMPGQSYAPQPAAQQPKIMEWVEGEVGAKAYQMPAGWPANQPIPLWDSTDTVIWLKSWGPMGIPNPMQKLKYEMPEQQGSQALLNAGNAGGGQSGASAPDMSQYVTRNEMEQMKEELKNVLSSGNNARDTGYSGNVQNMNYSGNNGGGTPNRGGLEGYRISGNENGGNQNGSGNSMNRGGQ